MQKIDTIGVSFFTWCNILFNEDVSFLSNDIRQVVVFVDIPVHLFFTVDRQSVVVVS